MSMFNQLKWSKNLQLQRFDSELTSRPPTMVKFDEKISRFFKSKIIQDNET